MFSPEQAWRILREKKNSELIDVRTVPEWQYVGAPDLGDLGKETRRVCWQNWPEMVIDPEFIEKLAQILDGAGVDRDASLLFLCRSGARSRAAAQAMTGAGYRNCFNVAEGFEGDINQETRHRDGNGWKNAGLPWRQN